MLCVYLCVIELGGKANFLSVELCLREFDDDGKPVSLQSSAKLDIDIPLKVSLYFESGAPVEDSVSEIFRFAGDDYDAIVINRDTHMAKIQFRLEKVNNKLYRHWLQTCIISNSS